VQVRGVWVCVAKKKNSKFKNRKLTDFAGFQLPEVRGKKKRKYHQISILVFQCVANL
jgi:hypothetical protein